MGIEKPNYIEYRGVVAALTANQYIPLLDTTQVVEQWVAAAALPAPGKSKARSLCSGGRIVGHVYAVGQPITLGIRYLRGDDVWDTIAAKPDVTVAAGASGVTTISWLFSDYAQDVLVFAQAGATPPTNIYKALTIIWDRAAGVS